jgi:hypothetical protein
LRFPQRPPINALHITAVGITSPAASISSNTLTVPSILPPLHHQRSPWRSQGRRHRVPASRAEALHRNSSCARCCLARRTQHCPLVPMGPLCSGRSTPAHTANARMPPRARSRHSLGAAQVRSYTACEPLQRRLARVPLTRQRHASRASSVHTRACALLFAHTSGRARRRRSPRALRSGLPARLPGAS